MATEGFLSRYLKGLLPYVRCHITVNKTFPSFQMWLRTTDIIREEIYCHNFSVLLFSVSSKGPSDRIAHTICYTRCGALVGTRNTSMGAPGVGQSDYHHIREDIHPLKHAQLPFLAYIYDINAYITKWLCITPLSFILLHYSEGRVLINDTFNTLFIITSLDMVMGYSETHCSHFMGYYS